MSDLGQTVMEGPGGLWSYRIDDWSGDSITFQELSRAPLAIHTQLGKSAGIKAPITINYILFKTSEDCGAELTLEQAEAFAEAILARVKELRKA